MKTHRAVYNSLLTEDLNFTKSFLQSKHSFQKQQFHHHELRTNEFGTYFKHAGVICSFIAAFSHIYNHIHTCRTQWSTTFSVFGCRTLKHWTAALNADSVKCFVWNLSLGLSDTGSSLFAVLLCTVLRSLCTEVHSRATPRQNGRTLSEGTPRVLEAHHNVRGCSHVHSSPVLWLRPKQTRRSSGETADWGSPQPGCACLTMPPPETHHCQLHTWNRSTGGKRNEPNIKYLHWVCPDRNKSLRLPGIYCCHKTGSVRIFQFSDTRRQINCADLENSYNCAHIHQNIQLYFMWKHRKSWFYHFYLLFYVQLL